MIKIKPLVGDWKESNEEEALKYARQSYNSITTMSGQKLVDYINENKVQGIKFSEDELKVRRF
jgi:hypothetical protein